MALRDSLTTPSRQLITYVWDHPGNQGRRVRALARLVGWQVRKRLVRRPVTLQLVGGLRMKCHPHSKAAALVLSTGLPEWDHMNFVRDFLRPGDLFVDVGANVGTYSLLAAATRDVEVIAFEPSTIAYRRLVENIDLNDLGVRVRARQVAVGAESGRALISVGLDAVNHLVNPSDAGNHESVAMEPLDRLLDSGASNVTLIKIDVEGFEAAVLEGGSALIGSAGPVLIVEANDPHALRELLEPLGYQPCSYDPARGQLAVVDWFDIHDNNLLAVRDRSSVNSRLLARRFGASRAQPEAPLAS